MTSAGTPWGEPRRDALAEVVKVACREWAGLDETKEEMRHEFALMIADAVLQHLASQRQEQDDDGCGPHHEYRGEPVDCGEYIELVVKPLRAQAAAQGAIIEDARVVCDKLAYQLAAKDALVARLVNAARMLLAEFKGDVTGEYSSPASREFEKILAELPPSRTP